MIKENGVESGVGRYEGVKRCKRASRGLFVCGGRRDLIVYLVGKIYSACWQTISLPHTHSDLKSQHMFR